jgi:hypothetical protein
MPQFFTHVNVAVVWRVPCTLSVSRLMYEISRISFSPLSLIISYVTRDHENCVYPLPLPAPVKRPDVNIKLRRSFVTLLLDIPLRPGLSCQPPRHTRRQAWWNAVYWNKCWRHRICSWAWVILEMNACSDMAELLRSNPGQRGTASFVCSVTTW